MLAIAALENDMKSARETTVRMATKRDKVFACLGPRTEQDFIAHGRSCIQPSLDYYSNLYNSPRGDMYIAKKAFQSVRALNPLLLKDMDDNSVSSLINDIALFAFPEFTQEHMKGLRTEIPLLLRHSRAEFDWSAVPGADEFDRTARVHLKNKISASATGSAVEEPDEKIVKSAWLENPGEKSRRIWEWWVCRLRGRHDFVFFKQTIRLVVLVQPSSAIVERANSRLQRIIETVGETALADTYEYRMLVQLNH
jgi:hypothetical protein